MRHNLISSLTLHYLFSWHIVLNSWIMRAVESFVYVKIFLAKFRWTSCLVDWTWVIGLTRKVTSIVVFVIIWSQYEYRGGLVAFSGTYLLHLSTDGSAIYTEMYFYGFSHTLQTVAIVAPCHGSWFPVHRLIWFQPKRSSPVTTNRRLDIYTGDDYGPFTAIHTAWLVAFLTFIEL